MSDEEPRIPDIIKKIEPEGALSKATIKMFEDSMTESNIIILEGLSKQTMLETDALKTAVKDLSKEIEANRKSAPTRRTFTPLRKNSKELLANTVAERSSRKTDADAMMGSLVIISTLLSKMNITMTKELSAIQAMSRKLGGSTGTSKKRTKKPKVEESGTIPVEETGIVPTSYEELPKGLTPMWYASKKRPMGLPDRSLDGLNDEPLRLTDNTSGLVPQNNINNTDIMSNIPNMFSEFLKEFKDDERNMKRAIRIEDDLLLPSPEVKATATATKTKSKSKPKVASTKKIEGQLTKIISTLTSINKNTAKPPKIHFEGKKGEKPIPIKDMSVLYRGVVTQSIPTFSKMGLIGAGFAMVLKTLDATQGSNKPVPDTKTPSILSKLFGGKLPKGLLGLGPQALLAGIVWSVFDGIQGYFASDEWGVSKIAGIVGGVLGGTDSGIPGAIKGAIKFALLGAGLGSVIPGAGTVAGGLIGGILGGVLGLFGGEEIAGFLNEIPTVIAGVWDTFEESAEGQLIILAGTVIGLTTETIFGATKKGIEKLLETLDVDTILKDAKSKDNPEGDSLSITIGRVLGNVSAAIVNGASTSILDMIIKQRENKNKLRSLKLTKGMALLDDLVEAIFKPFFHPLEWLKDLNDLAVKGLQKGVDGLKGLGKGFGGQFSEDADGDTFSRLAEEFALMAHSDEERDIYIKKKEEDKEETPIPKGAELAESSFIGFSSFFKSLIGGAPASNKVFYDEASSEDKKVANQTTTESQQVTKIADAAKETQKSLTNTNNLVNNTQKQTNTTDNSRIYNYSGGSKPVTTEVELLKRIYSPGGNY